MLELMNEEALEDNLGNSTDPPIHACDAFQVSGCSCGQQAIVMSPV